MDERMKCTHVRQNASWINPRRVKRIESLYATDPATAAKELRGMIQDDTIPCFDKKMLARMFTSPHVVPLVVPSHIFISADPSGGGISNLGLAAQYFDPSGKLVVRTHQILSFDAFLEICENLRDIRIYKTKSNGIINKCVDFDQKLVEMLTGVGKNAVG